MRLKCVPGDFQVREVLDFVPDGGGPYFVHRLRKEKLDTQRALSIVAARARVGRADIAFAGLKDRQGKTEQWISIRGARLDYRGEGIQVRCVGRSRQPVTSKMSRGNEFAIVLRDVGESELERIRAGVRRVAQCGFANYFDDQRFGCLRHGQGFVLRDVLAGRFEEALRRLIAVPSPVAITGDVKLKRVLERRWGDWQACAAVARGPVHHKLFQHLIREPEGFRGALALLPARQKLIHAFAYQSYLWNRAASRFLERLVPATRRIRVLTRAGSYTGLGELLPDERARLLEERTPLFGSSGRGGSDDFRRAMAAVLREEQLSDGDFQGLDLPGMMLREELRPILVVPRGLGASPPRRDERHRGRWQVRLRFGLPRGAYATMLIKHLMAADAGRASRPGDRRRHRAARDS